MDADRSAASSAVSACTSAESSPRERDREVGAGGQASIWLAGVRRWIFASIPGSRRWTNHRVQHRLPRGSSTGECAAISRGTARMTRALGISDSSP
ncbi:MAG: hypothetical protein R3B09_10375 [Nannocystaceae bacterium]